MFTHSLTHFTYSINQSHSLTHSVCTVPSPPSAPSLEMKRELDDSDDHVDIGLSQATSLAASASQLRFGSGLTLDLDIEDCDLYDSALDHFGKFLFHCALSLSLSLSLSPSLSLSRNRWTCYVSISRSRKILVAIFASPSFLRKSTSIEPEITLTSLFVNRRISNNESD